ncbi:porin [Paraburkholderia sp. ZP32-5]|uniref:porin n=1 Tax=Paraburkholderia sp. ZP32-5 TaxID=2883245 RepID=UPI001F429FE0|nr:porin [Paraburkholderia sp. ZP32-5]
MSRRMSVVAATITLAVGGMASAARAQSSVSLYGLVDAFAGAVHPSGAPGTAWTVSGGGMSTSYWGLKGSEDLGGNLKAVFALEDFFRINNGRYGSFDGQSLFARNAYVGLQSTLGTLTLGRNTVPLFVSTILFNPFVDSFNFSPMVLHTYIDSGIGPASVQGDTGWDNSVLYSTPNFGGLSGSLIYGTAGIAGHPGEANFGGNLLYFGGRLAATAAFQSVKETALLFNGASRQDAYQAGVSYDFTYAKAYAQYQHVDNNDDVHDDTGQLGISAPIGSGSALVSWSYTRRRAAVGSKIWNTGALGYVQPLSKRTSVYATYLYDKVSAAGSGSGFGVGIRQQF